MPQIIACPDCERKLRVPDDLLGKKVRCPGCSVMFKAASISGDVETSIEAPPKEPATRRSPTGRDDRYAGSPSPRRREDAEEDSDRPRRRRDDDYDDDDRGPSPSGQKAGWNKVRLGINLVMIGTWVWIGGTVLGGLGGMLGIVLVWGALTTGGGQAGLASLGAGGVVLLASIGVYYAGAFVELVLRLTGYGLCMAVPPKRDSALRPLAITAFALAVVYVLFSLLQIVVSGFSGFASGLSGGQRMNVAGNALNGVGLLCAIASFIVYMFFLRSVCNNVRARQLAGKPIAVFVAFICYWVAAIFIIIVLACAGGATLAKAMQSQSQPGGGNPATSIGVWFIVFLIVLGMLVLVYLGLQVWYVMVLQKIRDAVASYRRRL